MEAFKVIVPVYIVTRDYTDVLKKLGSFLFYETFFAVLFLRNIPAIDAFLTRIESYGTLGRFLSFVPGYEKLNVAGIVIALAFSALSYAGQFHDRISDVLGIRRRFDRDYILIPLAAAVGITLGRKQIRAIEKERARLMHRVFYAYTSSRRENTVVDPHDIEHALSAWSWFWVCVEGGPLFFLCSIIALQFGAPDLAAGFGTAAMVYFTLATLQCTRLDRYAKPQIESIARNADASKAVRAAFNAL